MEILQLLEKGMWAGFAALGFAILFNVPRRALFSIWLLGAIGGIVKFGTLSLGGNIIIGSFLGASMVGILSIPISHKVHSPPFIFSIPAVIPMVPGAFAYRMMLGLIDMAAGTKDGSSLNTILVDTVQNGLKVLFILLALAVGVAVPMLVTRKESAKRIRIKL